MNAELIEKNLEVLAEAEGGIPKLRELILQLAVTGRLVEQNLSEEPASTWLSRSGIDSYSTAEVLHAGWVRIRLKNLGEFRGGGTPSKEKGQYWGGDIPWVSPKDMKRLRIGESIDTVTQCAVNETAIKLIPSGSILMVVRGMILAHSFPVALTTRNVTVNQDMKALILKDDGIAEYVLLALRANRAKMLESVERSTHGTCRIDSEKISNFEIDIPPLREQRRIISKVDELMSLCDELERRQQRRHSLRRAAHTAALDALTQADTPDELERAWGRLKQHWDVFATRADAVPPLRQAILKLAVQGRLVKQDSKDESVDELLARLSARLDRAVPAILTISEETSIPASWRWVSFGGLVEDITSGWSPNCESRARGPGEWGVLKVSAVSWGRFLPDENKALPATEEPRLSCEVRSGDFLMSRANTAELVGRSVVVRDTPARLMLSDKLLRVAVAAEIDRDYLNLFNASMGARAYMAQNSSGTSASMRNVSRDIIKEMPVPLPPLAEQKRIVAKVEELMTLCDELERRAQAREEILSRAAKAAVAVMTGAGDGAR